MPTHHVFVFDDGQSLLVRPGAVVTGKNTKVKLRNFSSYTVFVEVPKAVGGGAVNQQLTVPPKGTDDIDIGNPTDGVYDYSVFALANPPIVGQGGSAPKIIIDP